MIRIMSWRNIWRNTTRSLVVIVAVALGVWAAMFMSGFATGMAKSYVNGAITNVVSHIQIHQPDYAKDNDIKFRIPHPDAVAQQIMENPQVRAVSVRTLVNGMISSTKGARGIRIKGIDPEEEAAVSALHDKVKEGEYLDGGKHNPVLVSRKLAEKLGLKLHTKVVLTFQDIRGEIVAAAFRVVGIFDTGNGPFDEAHIFALRTDLNRLLISNDGSAPPVDSLNIAHEIAIMLKDPATLDAATKSLRQEFPKLKVETYRQISPDLELYESQIHTMSIIYLTVIMLALVFGIVNTMLMAVLERMRELGMLMAIGMNKRRIFLMIMLETIMLGIVAAPVGLLLGYLTIAYLGKYGIDLSAYSNSLSMYGISNVIYFELDPIVYWQVPVFVAVTAVAASIYPAFRATRLQPVEAIRTI